MCFLENYLHLCVDQVLDASHRVHNDISLSFKAAQVWDVVLLMAIPNTVYSCPFLNGSYWRQLQGDVQEWLRVSDRNDPLFQLCLPEIAKDEGKELQVDDVGWQQAVWDSLPECRCVRSVLLRVPRYRAMM